MLGLLPLGGSAENIYALDKGNGKITGKQQLSNNFPINITGNLSGEKNRHSKITENVVSALAISGSISAPTSVCQNSTAYITFSVAGGVHNYTFLYTVNGGAQTTLLLTSGSSIQLAINTSAPDVFTYQLISVTDGLLAVDAPMTQVTVTVHALPTVNSITGPSMVCAGSSVSLTSTTPGGVWSSASPSNATITAQGTLTGITKGTTSISYTLTDVNGCIATRSVTETVNPLPVFIPILPPLPVICQGTTAFPVSYTTSNAPDQYNIIWDATALSAGFTNVNENLSSINLTATSGTLTVTNIPANVSGVFNGSLVVKSSSTGCVSVPNSSFVQINPLPTFTVNPPATVCSPNTIDITAAGITSGISNVSGSFTYFRDAGATTSLASANGITSSGTYYIKGVSAASCITVQPVSVTINPIPAFTVNHPAAVCSPNTIDITSGSITSGISNVLGAFTYFRDAGATTSLASANAITSTGTYYIKGVSATGCVTVQPVSVTINALPVFTVNNPAPVCSPNTIDITAGGITSSISNVSGSFTYFNDAGAATSLASANAITSSGTYYIKGVSATGCVTVQPVSVTINQLPAFTVNHPAAVCSPNTIDIAAAGITSGISNVSGSFTYFRDAGATSSLASANAITSTGTYYIKGVSVAGCVTVQPVSATINPLPAFIVNNPAAVCSPNTINLSAVGITAVSNVSGSFTYFRDAGGTTSLASANAITSTGTYYIKGVSALGCVTVNPVLVTINPLPAFTVNPPDAVCLPNTIDITAAGITSGISNVSGSFAYFRDAGATTSLASANAITSSGTYYIKGVSALGCVTVNPVLVTINPLPAFTVNQPAAVCSPNTIDITAAGITSAISNVTASFTYFSDAGGTTSLASANAITSSGTYYIKGVSALGCVAVNPVLVTINPLPAFTVNPPDAVCSPNTINITAAGITTALSNVMGSFTYFLDAGATVSLASANAITSSGTYYIKAFSATGCENIQSVAVIVNPQPVITVSATRATITSGMNTQLTATGANTYSWSPPGGLSAVTGAIVSAAPLTSTLYTVTGSDANNCTNIANIALMVNAVLSSGSISSNQSVCSGKLPSLMSSVSIATGGTGAILYQWQISTDNINFSDIAGASALDYAHNFPLTQTTYFRRNARTSVDAILSSNVVTVTVNPLPTISIQPSVISVEPGANTSLVAGGANFYTWSPAISISATSGASVSVSPVNSQLYIVTGTDLNGCVNTGSVNVLVNGSLQPGAIGNDQVICKGSVPSVINNTVSPTGGSGTYLYQWQSSASMSGGFKDIPGATAIVYTPLDPLQQTTYYRRNVYTQALGVIATNIVTVTVNNLPVIAINPSNPTISSGTAVTLTASGANDYVWSPSTFLSVVTGSVVQSTANQTIQYTVTGTDANKCSATGQVTVTVNGSLLPGSIGSDQIICPNSSPKAIASITAATGGTGVIQYQWQSSTTSPLTGFTDIAGATSLNYTPSGTLSTTTYLRRNAFTGLDAAFPSNVVTITINNLSAVSINGANSVCIGSSFQFSGIPVGGTWSSSNNLATINNSGNLTGITPGSLSVIYTYAHPGGCVTSVAQTVTVNTTPVSSSIIGNTVICVGSTTNFSNPVTGGVWRVLNTSVAVVNANGQVTAIGKGETDIQYVVTNAAGCSSATSSKIQVLDFPVPPAIITNGATGICNGGTVLLQSSSATGNQWYKGGVSIAGETGQYYTATSGGNYTVSVTNGNGCVSNTTSAAVNIAINPLPLISINTPAAVCQPAVVDLTASAVTLGSSPGLSFTYWQDATGLIALSNPDAIAVSGSYYIKALFPATGCAVIKSVQVTVNPLPQVFITQPATVCAPATINLVSPAVTSGSTPGLTYSYWLDNTANTQALTSPSAINNSGTFYIRGTAAGTGCSAIKPVTVSIQGQPLLSIRNPEAICAPGTVNLSRSEITTGSAAGLVFSRWLDDKATQPLLNETMVNKSGIYYIRGTNMTGCSAILPVSVTIQPQPVFDIISPPAVCMPGNVDLTQNSITPNSTSGTVFSRWKNNQATIPLQNDNAVNQQGEYYIKGLLPASGCFSVKPVTVSIHPLPNGTLENPAVNFICEGTALSLHASGSDRYQWYLNQQAIAGAQAPEYKATNGGNYTIEFISNEGCKVTAASQIQLDLLVKPILNFSIAGKCIGVPLNFTNETAVSGSGGLSWVWDFGDGNLSNKYSVVHTYGKSGTYVVTLTANNATCPDLLTLKSVSLAVEQPVPGIRYPTVNVLGGASVVVNARAIGVGYLWQPPFGLSNALISGPSVNITEDRTYTVQITSAAGCLTVDTVLVKVLTNGEILVPKAFSPNADGNNDKLFPILEGISKLNYFKVFNRWGNLVFQTNDATPGNGWTGKTGGIDQPIGVYSWAAEGVDQTGNIIRRGGTVMILR